MASFERELIQWADNFTKQNNKTPTPIEINDRVNRMLAPVVLDPTGFTGNRRKQDGAAFEINYAGDPLDPDDDLTLEDVRGATLEINGKEVESNLLDRFIGGFKEALGRNPTAQEVVEGLIESGVFE